MSERVLAHMVISISRLKSLYHAGLTISRGKVMYVLFLPFLSLCSHHYLSQMWLNVSFAVFYLCLFL